MYIFHNGGPYPKQVQVWVTKGPSSRNPADHAAALNRARENIKLHATREMKRAFFDAYSPAVKDKAVLRSIWSKLDAPLR